MGKASLMPRPGPAHLGAEPVGDPEFRANVAEEFRDHRLAPARGDHAAGAVAVMEYPGPPGLLADPGAGLVGLQDGARQEPVADQARLMGKTIAAGLQHVGE